MKVYNNQLDEIEFHPVVQQGVSLCIHTPDLQRDFQFRQWCDTISPLVDRIVAISSQNHLVHQSIRVWYPTWTTLSDLNWHWITDSMSREMIQPTEETVARWRTQQIWLNGEMIQQWYQPIDNEWHHFSQWLKSLDSPQSWINSQVRDNSDFLWIQQQFQLKRDDLFRTTIRSKWIPHADHLRAHPFQWYRLIPNPELVDVVQNLKI